MSRDEVHGREHLVARQVAMAKAFQHFAALWPNKFHQKHHATLLTLWIDGTGGIDTDLLEPAARRYCSQKAGQYPPKPAEFGMYARAMQAQHTRSSAAASAPSDGEQSMHEYYDVERCDTLGNRAYAVLGAWTWVAEVWALIWKTAPHQDNRDAARRGQVPTDVFDDAVEAIRLRKESGERVPMSPFLVEAFA